MLTVGTKHTTNCVILPAQNLTGEISSTPCGLGHSLFPALDHLRKWVAAALCNALVGTRRQLGGYRKTATGKYLRIHDQKRRIKSWLTTYRAWRRH